jgi:hypothetical protein
MPLRSHISSTDPSCSIAVKHTFYLLVCSVLFLTGCERPLALTEPMSARLDAAAGTGAVTLASGVPLPSDWKIRVGPFGDLEAYYADDVYVPSGEFTIDVRVEGTIKFWNHPYQGRTLIDEFGPGGATGEDDWYYLDRGDGAVLVGWWPTRGRTVGYGPTDAERGANPVYSTSFQVRGPGVIRMGRVYLRAGFGFNGGYTESNQTFTILATPVAQASVKLSCIGDLGPNSVTRGKEVICTAEKNPTDAAGALTVTHWSFDGATRGDGDLQSPEWRGIMARGGMVQVRGKIGSGAEQTATATIQVVDRTWADVPLMHLRELSASGDEARVPPLASKVSWASDLGGFNAYPEPPPGEQLEDPIVNIDGGPNHGLYYFADLSFPIWGRIRINDAAMTRGSPFYQAQERNPSGGSNRIGGQAWCSNRVVTSVYPDLVRAHERRHAEVYRQKYGEVVRGTLPDLERMAATYTELADRYEPLRVEADTLARRASEAIHELEGNPNRITPSENGRECNLKNEDGGLLENPPKQESER